MRVTVTGIDGANGLEMLAADFDHAAEASPGEVRKVLARGALNVKNDWRDRWQGIAHAPALPRAITYDVTRTGDLVRAEIGPDKDKRQGALGNLIEFGSVNNAPIPGGAPALEAERVRFERALEDVAVDLIDKR